MIAPVHQHMLNKRIPKSSALRLPLKAALAVFTHLRPAPKSAPPALLLCTEVSQLLITGIGAPVAESS